MAQDYWTEAPVSRYMQTFGCMLINIEYDWRRAVVADSETRAELFSSLESEDGSSDRFNCMAPRPGMSPSRSSAQ